MMPLLLLASTITGALVVAITWVEPHFLSDRNN